ncbi:MAG: alanine racemase [Proteobacteria bacterium]|nr:alanine racemase [Pseudomonadota bacterium]
MTTGDSLSNLDLYRHGPNRHAQAIIDLESIRHNYRLLKQISGDRRLIAVIKADAYGHGAVEVARALPQADAFAVAAVGEAVALREAGVEQKILVLGGFIRAQELQTCIDNRLDPVIHQQTHLDCLRNIPDLNELQVWVKIDTGMGRLGYPLKVVADVIDQLDRLLTLGQVRMMTHLASANDIESPFTDQQIDAVKSLGLDDYEWGVANSAGILGWPLAHQNWVRAGIALYGANPLSNRKQAPVDLKPSMQMKTSVLAVKRQKKGDVIGYSNRFTCPKDMKIAVIAAGYADGYPRHNIKTAQVNIHGRLCDNVGRVSMDMITVDVSGIKSVEVGDQVILVGESPEASDLADWSETIAYEIFCNVGAHVRRPYLNKD